MIFGTDGIRGTPGQYPLTPELLYGLGRALVEQNPQKVRLPYLVGRDTRWSANQIIDPVTRGICDAGGHIRDAGILPTPGLAYLVRHHSSAGGIMITASHNPASDNGIKLFNSEGEKLTKAQEASLERSIGGRGKQLKPYSKRIAKNPYCEHLLSGSPDFRGMHVVLDCANGGASLIAPWILSRTGAKVSVLGAEPTGHNINESCGALYPEKVSHHIHGHQADFGVSFDGDADRAVFVDENGKVIDGDAILYLNAIYLRDKGLLNQNTLVATDYSNTALDDLLERESIHVVREECGDRNVYYAMKHHGYSFGGENSGHLIFPGKSTGDGIYSALMLARILQHYKRPLSGLVAGFRPYPQLLKSYPVEQKVPLDRLAKTNAVIADLKATLGGRVMLRYSGTEPKVRVLIEGMAQNLDQYAERIYAVLKGEIACRQ
ncbi:MAG: phosphoglucosamine mutase [Nanobdellota archaeon]